MTPEEVLHHAQIAEGIRALTDEITRLREALERIRNERKPQVCQNYELCTHEGCRASYEAFAIADAALASHPTQEQKQCPRCGSDDPHRRGRFTLTDGTPTTVVCRDPFHTQEGEEPE